MAVVFGPGRFAAARAAYLEMVESGEVLTGWADYDTPALVARHRAACELRAQYSEYSDDLLAGGAL